MRHLLWIVLALAAVGAGAVGAAPVYAQEAAPPAAAPADPAAAPGADPGIPAEGEVELTPEEQARLEAATAEVNETISDFLWRVFMTVIAPFLVAILVLIWVGMADWVNRDSQIFNLNYRKWNPIVFFPFAIIGIAMLFVPVPHWVRLLIYLVVLIASFAPYIVVHNRSVLPHQTVLTGAWWRHLFATGLGRVGVKVNTERIADYEKGVAVDFFAMGAAGSNEDNANLLTARQSPGYVLAKELVADMVTKRSDRALLEYGPQGVALRHEIDGVWHPGEPRDRESGDVMLAVLKTLANLDAKDRRKKQEGRFAAKFDGKKYLMPIMSQGVANGERVVITRLNEKIKPHTYEALGIREALKDKWAEIMSRDKGMVVFSAMPAGGLTTMTNASIEETDRLMRDFFSIEEVHRREVEMQNVTVHTYDAAKGETPATLIPKLVRQYPNVYICRDLVDAESGTLLMNEIEDERLIITAMPAREAAEALLRLLQMKLPQKQFASVVTAVLYQRLIRKLCPDCKVGYTPPAEVLKKLGIPPGKVQQLFRPPKPEERENEKQPICQTCQGVGYVGRTGIFELLEVTDQMREILAKQPNLDLLRKAARADGQRSLQEEGILLVAKGVTALQELQRVLK
jgi:type II secretory ATPase GspE/PulE/Tfp pilus assembly ATPase PilB-like protein